MPAIKITAKHEPYRRCGMSHSREGTVHDADTFTSGQLEVLRADPHLVVTDGVPVAASRQPPAAPASATVPAPPQSPVEPVAPTAPPVEKPAVKPAAPKQAASKKAAKKKAAK